MPPKGHWHIRTAAIALLPCVRDDQLQRIWAAVLAPFPRALVSRVTDQTVLVQELAIKAESSHDADAIAWEQMQSLVRSALGECDDTRTTLTSIDITPPGG